MITTENEIQSIRETQSDYGDTRVEMSLEVRRQWYVEVRRQWHVEESESNECEWCCIFCDMIWGSICMFLVFLMMVQIIIIVIILRNT